MLRRTPAREPKQKVVDLAKLVARYSGPIRLHVVNFTRDPACNLRKCPHDRLTIIMRRYMMKIAEAFARQDKCLGLITGEYRTGSKARRCIPSPLPTGKSAPCRSSVR